jgi:hypothetical protein
LEILLISSFCFLAACPHVAGFPTEDEMNARLRPDMTIEEVISAFGQPGTGVGQRSGPSKLRYVAPIGLMTAKKEGYIGFEVQLVDGKVRGWRAFFGNPSYAPMTAPPAFWWTFRFWGILFVGAFVYGVIRAFQRGMSEEKIILRAYRERNIPTRKLPVEFRFITNDTTLQEVIERVGPYSRKTKFPVDPTYQSGYGFAEGPLGMAALTLFEYDLPYHATVILLPEYPFEPENRIRAAFYRRPRPDEEA